MRRSEAKVLLTPKSRRRREELLVAARATFEERGYFDTRVADIVTRAEVSHGTFYTYFDSKDDVLRALVETLSDDLFEASMAPVDRHATPFLTLEATIRRFMHAYRDRAGLIRILEQATSYSEEFLAIRLGIRVRFRERLEVVLHAQRAQHPDGEAFDAALVAYALGGMVEDFARGCYVLEHLEVEEEAITTLAVLWARAVGLPIDRDGGSQN